MSGASHFRGLPACFEHVAVSRAIPLTQPRGSLILLDGERRHVLVLRLGQNHNFTFEMDGAARDALTDACLRWQSPEQDMPAEEVSLLLALESEDTDEVILGYRDGGLWMRDSGQVLRENVSFWTYAPTAPKKGGAR